MPEGPEIRREALALHRALVAAPIERIEYRVPRLAAQTRRLRGAQVAHVTSRGKAMLIAYDVGLTHYSHNQLYGSWHVVPRRRAPAWLASRARSVRVLIATPRHAAVLLAATDIELLDAQRLAAHPFLAKLGPDVLDRTTTADAVAARLRDPAFARRSLAALLLDQSFLAGLGNYLRSEILHAAGLDRARRPVDLADGELTLLARAALALPRRSLATRGITNDPARVRALRAAGADFATLRFAAYGREGERCYRCGGRIRRAEAAGRGVYFCPRCQPA